MMHMHPLSEGEQRRKPRVSVDALAVVSSSRRSVTTRLHNISAGGALLGPMFDVDVGDDCELEVPGYGAVRGVVCRVTSEFDVAICFSPDRAFHDFCEDTGTLLASVRHGKVAFRRDRQRPTTH